MPKATRRRGGVMGFPGRRRLVVAAAAACVIAVAALVPLCIGALASVASMPSFSQAIDQENAHNEQLLALRHDMQPTLDEFEDILSGKQASASEKNAALSAYERIGRQSSAERAAGSYLHVDSYIEDCDVSEDGGTVRVMYECSAITVDSEKVVIVDRTRATWGVEKQGGSWAVASVHDDNPALAPDGRP
jgi:hypothetical protein